MTEGSHNLWHIRLSGVPICAGLYDSRVSFWEPAKWVANTRRLTTGRPVILLLTQLEAGHAGVSGVYGQLRETALQQAFLLRATCMATQRTSEVGCRPFSSRAVHSTHCLYSCEAGTPVGACAA